MTERDAQRDPAVAGSFYPGRADALGVTVQRCLDDAPVRAAAPAPVGVLVPHAGLVYSGGVAAAGWRALLESTSPAPTVVILGTNHSAWFEGVAVFERGAWRTPLGETAVDDAIASAILGLGEPFGASRAAHAREHAIEVQLPLVAVLRPAARIVPCSVAAGTGAAAIEAGERLGRQLADLHAQGAEIVVAISTDMAHYPPHDEAVAVTARLSPLITALDAPRLAAAEQHETSSGARGMACGMCGIQPTVLGLAALRAMGASAGTVLAAATSADAGADPDRTVGYLAVAFV